MSRLLGPNMKKLIAHKMSVDAIPAGEGFGAGLKFLTTPGALATGWKKAIEWCDGAIAVIRLAAEPNPWKESTEERNRRRAAAKDRGAQSPAVAHCNEVMISGIS